MLPGWRKETPQEDQDDALIHHISSRIVGLLQTETALRDNMPARAAAGQVLAAIGDPRPGVGLTADGLPDIEGIRIPGTALVVASGKFPQFDGLRLGTGAKLDPQAYDDEKWPEDKAALQIADFEIAAYPVTVAQFRPFVEQGGYNDDRNWSAEGNHRRDVEGWEAPRYWENRVWTLPNHPLVGVSWYEAEAHCNWLNRRLPAALAVRLPTEAEWEWAARGPEGRIYPWGNLWETWRCNGGESGIGRTSAVGCFPGGSANWWREMQEIPGGVHDFSGNIWEWAASEWSEDYALAESGAINEPTTASRVLRGGSWDNKPLHLRCSDRTGSRAYDRGDYGGFRLFRTISL